MLGRTQWRLRTRHREVLVRVGRGGASEAAAAPLLIDLWFEIQSRNPEVTRAMAEILAALRGVPHAGGAAPDQARDALELALFHGELVLEEVRPPAHVPVLARPGGDDAVPAVEPAPITFELVLADRFSGEPLAGIALDVRTPAGDELRLETDAGGSIRVPGLTPGVCEVTSIAEGARLERSHVVRGAPFAARVDISRAGAGGEPPAHVLSVAPHRVATGETPDSIARMWGTTWSKLALFNWGTTDPAVLDERYRDELGCTKRTPDGKHHRFDDADDPGIVLIPYPWRARLEVGPTHRLSAEPLRPVFIALENESGLALPGAAYRLRDADGREHTGRLGRSGIARLTGLPAGPFSICYPDQADLLARSLAATVRRAFDDQATGPLFHLLGQAPDVVARAKAVYAAHFDDLTGKGLEADIDQVVTDPEARAPLLYFCALAGLRVEGVEEVVLPRPPPPPPRW